MYIREFKIEDNEKIKSLLEKQYGDDTESIDYFKYGDMKNCKYTIVAIDEDEIVGLGSLWENGFHKNANYIGLIVAEEFKRKGIGSELLKNLKSYENNKSLQGATWSNNLEALDFFTKRGFDVVRKTYEPIYDLSIGINFKIPSISDSYKVLTLKELNDEQNIEKIIGIFREAYERNHKFNKVSELSYSQWKNVVFNYLNYDGSIAIIKEGVVAAISLLYYGDEDDTLELGVRGVATDFLSIEKELVLNMLDKQLQYGKDNGFKFIKDEIDDIDSGAMIVGELSDLENMVSWNTLYLDFNR